MRDALAIVILMLLISAMSCDTESIRLHWQMDGVKHTLTLGDR